MAPPQTKPIFSIADYLTWEESQTERHEYHAGEVFAMSGGSDAHYTIIGNLYANLRERLTGGPCRAFINGMKVEVTRADAVLYPDVFVTCDDRDRAADAQLAKRHPTLIVEVLSDSTAAYDRGRKFELYQQLDSLREYLLIEQDRRHADLFRKNTAGRWELHPLGETDTLELASLEVNLPLSALYADVDLSPPDNQP